MNRNLFFAIKIIGWVLGIFLILMSVVGFLSEDFLIALFVFLIGLFFLPPVFLKIVGLSKLKLSSVEPKSIVRAKDLLKRIDLRDENIVSSIDKMLKSSKKKIKCKKFKKLGKAVYKSMLGLFLENVVLSENEVKMQDEIAVYFQLSKKEIREIKRIQEDRAVERLEALFSKRYNNKFSEKKMQEKIARWIAYFEIPEKMVKDAENSVLAGILENAFNKRLIDGMLSPQHEEKLNQTIEDLGIDEKRWPKIVSKASIEALKRGKLLWGLENGIFKPAEHPPMNLQKGEACYFAAQAALLERKEEVEYSMKGGGISIPVMDGFGLGLGRGKAEPVKKEVAIGHSGNLFLTNRRIVFIAHQDSSFQAPFDELLSFNKFEDGLMLFLNQKNYLLRIHPGDATLFSSGLESAIRNFNNPENEVYLQAKQEIERYKSLIDLHITWDDE